MSRTLQRMLWICVGLLNVAVIAFYALWAIANEWAAARSETHGFDPSQLLPHDALFWLVANASLLVLLATDVVLIVAAVAIRRSALSPAPPRHTPAAAQQPPARPVR